MRHAEWRKREVRKTHVRKLAPVLDCLEGRALLSTVTGPTTTADVTGHLGANGYYTSPVTVNLTASEPNVASSALTTEYRVNNGPLTTGNQVVLNNSGVDQVSFFSTDSSGNQGPTGSVTVRIDRTPPVLRVMANPTTLWPPNHKFDNVNVSGVAFDNVSGINRSAVFYFVRDSYGQVQPSGLAHVAPNGRFSFDVELQASRTGQDMGGRQYTIYVVAQNRAGEVSWRSVNVTVPHDQGHSGGSNGGNFGGGDDLGMSGGGGNGAGANGNHGHGNGHQNGHGHGNGNGHGNGHGHG